MLKYKVNAGPLDVQRDDPYNWADEKDDDDDDEDLDERAFWGAAEIEDVEGNSKAALREEQDLAFLDAAALAGLAPAIAGCGLSRRALALDASRPLPPIGGIGWCTARMGFVNGSRQ